MKKQLTKWEPLILDSVPHGISITEMKQRLVETLETLLSINGQFDKNVFSRNFNNQLLVSPVVLKPTTKGRSK